MPKYIDGFVVPVPKRKLDDYRKLAKKCGKIYIEYGALEYTETIADDMQPGKVTSFDKSVKLKRGETVALCYITYKSRAHRDRVNKKVMSDPRLEKLCHDHKMPFDVQRMFWGGFKAIAEVK